MDNSTIFRPPLLVQETLWGDLEYIPVCNPTLTKKESYIKQHELASNRTSTLDADLSRRLLMDYAKVEGVEEILCVQPYPGDLPKDISGVDERTPRNARRLGLHGFCNDKVLAQRSSNPMRVAQKAKNFLCAFGPNFSVFMDGHRCDAIEAINKNRKMTLFLQLMGIPTIQTASITSARFLDIAFAGLAPDCPVAFENMCVIRDPQQAYLLRMAVERLIELKSPTVLVVVGNRLPFTPSVPVVYYKSRIQKLRDHDYGK